MGARHENIAWVLDMKLGMSSILSQTPATSNMSYIYTFTHSLAYVHGWGTECVGKGTVVGGAPLLCSQCRSLVLRTTGCVLWGEGEGETTTQAPLYSESSCTAPPMPPSALPLGASSGAQS